MATTHKIFLNASHDLYEAGMDNSPEAVIRFEHEYRSAADRVAKREGVSIEVITDKRMAGQLQNDDRSNELWQMIHDECSPRA